MTTRAVLRWSSKTAPIRLRHPTRSVPGSPDGAPDANAAGTGPSSTRVPSGPTTNTLMLPRPSSAGVAPSGNATSTPCFPGCRGTMTVDDSSEPGTTSSRRRQQNPWKGAGSASKINAEPRSSAGRREGDAVGVTEVFRGEERAEHDAATARRRAQRTVPRTGRPRDRAAARRRAATLPHPRGHPGPGRARLRRRHGPIPRRRRPGRGHRRAGREALPAGGSSCRYVSWPAPPTACC